MNNQTKENVEKISSMLKCASAKHLYITFSRREGMQSDMQLWLEIENKSLLDTHTQSRHIVKMYRLDVNSKYSTVYIGPMLIWV